MNGATDVPRRKGLSQARNLRLLEKLQRVRAQDVAGDENERRSATRVAKFDLAVEAWTIKHWHPHIGDDEVIAPLIEVLQRRRGVQGGLNLVAIEREDLRQRSEEHTSELQSRLHLVCRLLLEKKKNKH